MRYARLTRPDGKPVYVNPSAIYFVTEAVNGPEGARSMLVHSGGQFFVKEVGENVYLLLEEMS